MTAKPPKHSNPDERSTSSADVQLDLRGLTCPMPLLKAKQALNKMAPGERLQVSATDPGSVRDFEVFCKQSGHHLLASHVDSTAAGEVFVYMLQKKDA